MALSKPAGGQYRLHAYVCGSACVRRSDSIGTMSFVMIFMKRPNDCRYAIVSYYDVVSHTEVVVVFDLYDTMERRNGTQLIAPPPIYVGDCVDAAIMATSLTYVDT